MKLEIAGRTIEDPLAAVGSYIAENERLLRDYDLGGSDGGPNQVSAQDLLMTRYGRIRIDSSEIQYFVDNGHTAPWSDVPVDAHLADADPDEEDGLYDAAEGLYMHFYNGRMRGVTTGKIHIVLHMKRRHLYPIVDGRINDIYDEAAREASKRVEARRGRRGRLFWAAIREDIIVNADTFEELRAALAERGEPEALGAQLSDVRLHDIACWSLLPRRR